MLRRALAGGWWRVGRWHSERSTYVTREAGGWRAGGKERRRQQIAARNADGLCAQGDEDIGLRQQMLRRKRADGAWGGRRVARRGLADAARGGAASGVRIASRRCAGTIFGSLEL